MRLEIAFQPDWVPDPSIGVIDEADQSSAVGVAFIPSYVDEELSPELTNVHRGACLLYLDDDPLFLEQEVHPGGGPGEAGRPLLRTNIVEVETEERVQQILNVIFVLDDDGGSSAVPGLQLAIDTMEVQADPFDEAQLIGNAYLDRARYVVFSNLIDERLQYGVGLL